MFDVHGLIYAFQSSRGLGELVSLRTSASLPFCSRYRLIDFALSAMTNAGIRDVGVIMQRDYQSLLDHLGSGKDWDLSRLSGGLKMLPPFGLSGSRHAGEYKGAISALSSIKAYIEGIKQNHVVLFRGGLAINLDLKAVYEAHTASGHPITAVCKYGSGSGCYDVRFVPLYDDETASQKMIFSNVGGKGSFPSTEVYIIDKSLLLDLISWCEENGHYYFHRDALTHYLSKGGTIGLYLHEGYTAHIRSISDYYRANMDMLRLEHRSDLFTDDNPIYTKGRSSVSTYYGEEAVVDNSLVADGCYIEGRLENCVLFRGVRVERGAVLKNCVIMQDAVISEDVQLSYVVSDKFASFSKGTFLSGSEELPLIVPKHKSL